MNLAGNPHKPSSSQDLLPLLPAEVQYFKSRKTLKMDAGFKMQALKQLDKDSEKDYFLSEKPRLDAPGPLHHMMERGAC